MVQPGLSSPWITDPFSRPPDVGKLGAMCTLDTRRDLAAPPDGLLFLGQLLREPRHVGAVAPSSARLAAAITAAIPEQGDPVVVELGAGTGVFTEAIRGRLHGRGHHVAVEVNPTFAALLRRRFPTVDVAEADAEALPEIVASRALTAADVVVSSLPWASFGAGTQDRLSRAVLGVLTPDSVFTTFAYAHAQYLPSARRFRALLAERFEEVVTSRTVWRNLPPAHVLHARRPRL